MPDEFTKFTEVFPALLRNMIERNYRIDLRKDFAVSDVVSTRDGGAIVVWKKRLMPVDDIQLTEAEAWHELRKQLKAKGAKTALALAMMEEILGEEK